MPERTRKKRPVDPNRLAHQIVQEATGQAPDEEESKKNPAAVSLGRLGGLKGGKARAAKMTAKERSEAARAAARARWVPTSEGQT